ncbi:MAG: non-hydrolyzing UDP-N-acetylglucosamine 2-epimerase [Saprospiraceae bacterium]
MKKILVILGTRPEVIKLAPVIQALQARANFFTTKICDTGQHRELKQAVLDFFGIRPDYQLDGMHHSQTLSSLTAYLLQQLPNILNEFQPDVVIVQGDTTSAFAGSLAAFYAKIKIAHVEAGLRTYQKNAPFPEEMHRTLITHLADWHFAPTILAKQQLCRENIAESKIYVVGNTVIDALHWTILQLQQQESVAVEVLKTKIAPFQQQYAQMLLFTLHRRENLEQHLPEITAALREILQQRRCFILFPVHLNPKVQDWANRLAQDFPNLLLTEPLPYEAFVWAMQHCDLIMTDSGGIQEEAPTLGKPVIVLRAHTERPEAQVHGTVRQVSIEHSIIVAAALQFLQQPVPITTKVNPFGDGTAAQRIVHILQE